MKKPCVIALLCAVLSILVIFTNVNAQTATATWQDNSGLACTPTQCDQEDRFVLEFAAGAGAFQIAGTTAPNITTLNHNISTFAVGTVLTYRVCAENSIGRSCSVATKYTVPAAPAPVQQIVIPIPPGAVGVTFVFP